jgi:NACalpha-BTF3-like transcription factor
MDVHAAENRHFETWRRGKSDEDVERALSALDERDVQLVFEQCGQEYNHDTCKAALLINDGDLVNAIISLSL